MPRSSHGIIVGEDIKGRERLRRSSTREPLAPLFIVSGLLFALVGWVDIALFYVPLRPADPEWRFGIVAQSFDAMALPTLGLLFLSIGVRLKGGPLLWPRLLATMLGVWAMLFLVALLLFALNIPLALGAAQASADAVSLSVLKLAIGKTLLFGLSYGIAYSWMAITMWQTRADASRTGSG